MKQKLILSLSFLGIVPIFIFFLILYSLYLLYANTHNLGKSMTLFNSGVHFKALPEQMSQTSVAIGQDDARVKVLDEFFSYYKSPLEPYSQLIVTTADEYNLDYRYIPAIAMQESNLCLKAPKDSFNCWGFGIYNGHVKKFASYDDAIETVTQTLAQEYKDKGLANPIAIMSKYTPSSNGSWANSVTYFMDNLQAAL